MAALKQRQQDGSLTEAYSQGGAELKAQPPRVGPAAHATEMRALSVPVTRACKGPGDLVVLC